MLLYFNMWFYFVFMCILTCLCRYSQNKYCGVLYNIVFSQNQAFHIKFGFSQPPLFNSQQLWHDLQSAHNCIQAINQMSKRFKVIKYTRSIHRLKCNMVIQS